MQSLRRVAVYYRYSQQTWVCFLCAFLFLFFASNASYFHLNTNPNQQFYACPATDNGEYDLYTTPGPSQKKCVNAIDTISALYQIMKDNLTIPNNSNLF